MVMIKRADGRRENLWERCRPQSRRPVCKPGRWPAMSLRALIQQLGYQVRGQAVRLVQVPQVRLGQWPTRAELG